MPISLGIPRGMLYHDYGRSWEAFYRELGAEIIISPQTNKILLDRGTELMVDEACLPLKIFTGHVDWLLNKCETIFIPRIVATEREGYTCPKILGLPDLMKALFPQAHFLTVTVDMRNHPWQFPWAVYQAGRKCTTNMYRVYKAFHSAYYAYHDKQKSKDVAQFQTTIAVLGHPYNLYDAYTGGEVLSILRDRGVNVLTSDMMDKTVWEEGANCLRKRLFWTYGRKIVGSAAYSLMSHEIDGIINVVSFGCGPDAFVSELIDHQAKKNTMKPILHLSFDEHSGEAGMVTRIEAFLDMIMRRKKNESSLPTYGNHVYSAQGTV